jgi:hypothetical protein
MKTEPSPKGLFKKYIRELKEQLPPGNKEKQLKHGLSFRDWSLYFFGREGKEHDYDVWCRELGKFEKVKSEFGDKLEATEFLCDLCWTQHAKDIDKEGRDFLALVLEQELNDWFKVKDNEVEDNGAWWDFTKILYVEATVMRVFIGISRYRNLQYGTVANECANYYKKVHCSDVGLLFILINWRKANKNLTIGGWELTKSGEAKPLVAEPRTFEYSGKV